MTPEEWLAAAKADASRRGLPALHPLLDMLADAARQLQGASWMREAEQPPVAPTPSPTSPARDTSR
jgi:hypothetical protein